MKELFIQFMWGLSLIALQQIIAAGIICLAYEFFLKGLDKKQRDKVRSRH